MPGLCATDFMLKIPFKLDRGGCESLTSQVASGFRRAIESGYYGPGDRIPGLRTLSDLLGVSMAVTRAALKILVDEHLVCPRVGQGVVVADGVERRWRGRILLVCRGHGENLAYNAMADAIRERMLAERYLFTQVSAYESRTGDGFVQLDQALKQGADLIIAFFPSAAMERRIAALGVPCVILCVDQPTIPQAHPVWFSRARAMVDFKARCRTNGIRRIIRVALMLNGVRRIPKEVNEGLEMDYWFINPRDEQAGGVEWLQRRTTELFMKKLSRRGFRMPDLFLFTDDFVATAALMAMSVRGVRIPEDVKVASWVNVGVGVPYPKTMAGFYFNLRGAGIRLAQYAFDVLNGKSLPEDAAVEIEYRDGETFPWSFTIFE